MKCNLEAQNFINNFYQAIIEKRSDDIVNCYIDSADVYVILEGPRLATKGIQDISTGWRDFCSSNIDLHKIEWLDGPYVFETSECASVAGVVRLIGTAKGTRFDNTFRASFMLLKTTEGYKIVHEHVSGALADPYGIGDWKKNA